MTDYTKQLVKKSFASTVTVKGGPISVKECKAFVKKHPRYLTPFRSDEPSRFDSTRMLTSLRAKPRPRLRLSTPLTQPPSRVARYPFSSSIPVYASQHAVIPLFRTSWTLCPA